MSTFNLVLLIGFSIASVPLLLRPIVTTRLANRLVRIARQLETIAEKRRVSGSPHINNSVSAILALAAMSPLIASGLAGPSRQRHGQSEDTTEDVEFFQFVDQNGWMLPYLSGTYWCFWVLGAIGRPYSILNWKRYIAAIVALAFSSNPDGSVRLMLTAKESNRTFRSVCRSRDPNGTRLDAA
jgi:hypothetical protein